MSFRQGDVVLKKFKKDLVKFHTRELYDYPKELTAFNNLLNLYKAMSCFIESNKAYERGQIRFINYRGQAVYGEVSLITVAKQYDFFLKEVL